MPWSSVHSAESPNRLRPGSSVAQEVPPGPVPGGGRVTGYLLRRAMHALLVLLIVTLARSKPSINKILGFIGHDDLLK